MRKIISLSIAVVLLIALVGITSRAQWTDNAVSDTNALTASTLDLNVDGVNTAVVTFAGTKVKPGDSGGGSTTLANVGEISGELDIQFSPIANIGGYGGTQYEDGVGDLGGVVELAVYIDVDSSGSWSIGDIGLKSDVTTYSHPAALDFAPIDSYDSSSWDAVEIMIDSASDIFTVLWRLPASAGNNIQGDGVSLDVTFTLEQPEAD